MRFRIAPLTSFFLSYFKGRGREPFLNHYETCLKNCATISPSVYEILKGVHTDIHSVTLEYWLVRNIAEIIYGFSVDFNANVGYLDRPVQYKNKATCPFIYRHKITYNEGKLNFKLFSSKFLKSDHKH